MKLNFPYIAIHAVSRDATVFPHQPCIFLVYSLPDTDEPEQEVTRTYRLCTEKPEQSVLDATDVHDCLICGAVLLQLTQYLR